MNTLDRLAEIETKILQLQKEYRGLLFRSAAIAREMGRLLLEARQLISPHHHWSRWLAMQLDMTPGTAHRYVMIAKRWDDIEAHPEFLSLTVKQMFDVARGKPPRKRSYNVHGQSLDVILDILDERLCQFIEHIGDVPDEIERFIDAVDACRPLLEKHGWLNRGVETRKQLVREARRIKEQKGVPSRCPSVTLGKPLKLATC